MYLKSFFESLSNYYNFELEIESIYI